MMNKMLTSHRNLMEFYNFKTPDDDWWRRLVTATDDGDWWWRLMTVTGDGDWWQLLMMETDDGNWWWRLMTVTDDGDWWQQPMTFTGDSNWWQILVTATDNDWWGLPLITLIGIHWPVTMKRNQLASAQYGSRPRGRHSLDLNRSIVNRRLSIGEPLSLPSSPIQHLSVPAGQGRAEKGRVQKKLGTI